MLDVLEVRDPLLVDLLEVELTHVEQVGVEPELLLALRQLGLDLLPHAVDQLVDVLDVAQLGLDLEALLQRRVEGLEVPLVGVHRLRAQLEHLLLDQLEGQVVHALALLDQRARDHVDRVLDDLAAVVLEVVEHDQRAVVAVELVGQLLRVGATRRERLGPGRRQPGLLEQRPAVGVDDAGDLLRHRA